ncbi:hypothetical protein ACQP1U_03940 [Actinomycetota bacterium]
MTTRHPLTVLSVVGLLPLTACSMAGGGGERSSKEVSAERSEGRLTGTGWFHFQPEGLPQIRVFYAAGTEDVAAARVVVVMHGTERNAETYRNTWEPIVDGRPVVVLVPEFSEEDFPSSRGYNLGGLRDGDDEDVEVGKRTFDYIDPLVAEAQKRNGSRTLPYDMFGHSAGGQFVHRFLEFSPESKVRRAVAANAGWYTMPDRDVRYPYGLKDAPGEKVDLERLFSRDLVILLGADDVKAERLRQDEGTERQGETRLARGMTFYERSRMTADDEDLDFAWRLAVVPSVGHEHAPMSAAAADILFTD